MDADLSPCEATLEALASGASVIAASGTVGQLRGWNEAEVACLSDAGAPKAVVDAASAMAGERSPVRRPLELVAVLGANTTRPPLSGDQPEGGLLVIVQPHPRVGLELGARLIGYLPTYSISGKGYLPSREKLESTLPTALWDVAIELVPAEGQVMVDGRAFAFDFRLVAGPAVVATADFNSSKSQRHLALHYGAALRVGLGGPMELRVQATDTRWTEEYDLYDEITQAPAHATLVELGLGVRP